MKPMMIFWAVAVAAFGLQIPQALAHPADITVTDFFVEQDWDATAIAPDRLRAVHSLNWFEALEIIDPADAASEEEILADLGQYLPTISGYLNDNLTVENAGQPCVIENIHIPTQELVEVTAVGLFFDFDVVCASTITEVTVTATFLLDKYPEQSNFFTFYRFPGDLIVTESLNAAQPSLTQLVADPQAVQSSVSLFSNFVYEGIRHIVPLGLDHILFIATVFLIAGTLGRVVLFSLLFTVAHSVTLALTVLGVIVPNSSLIEALIALSIIVLAVDAIRPTLPQRWQGGIIFGFGLFHGMGFASVLTDLGLPAGAETLALLGFNIGVEIGQLGVIAALFAATWRFFRNAQSRKLTTIAIATAIAVVATYWLIERTLL